MWHKYVRNSKGQFRLQNNIIKTPYKMIRNSLIKTCGIYGLQSLRFGVSVATSFCNFYVFL